MEYSDSPLLGGAIVPSSNRGCKEMIPKQQATPHSRHAHVYAVIRWDEDGNGPEEQITITKVLRTQEHARSEVDRLNALNQSKGCRYFYQVSRLVEPPDAGLAAGR